MFIAVVVELAMYLLVANLMVQHPRSSGLILSLMKKMTVHKHGTDHLPLDFSTQNFWDH
jgi:hypothetical protein